MRWVALVFSLATVILVVLGCSVVSRPPVEVSQLTLGGPEAHPDGIITTAITVFDADHPAVTKLDPTLLRALRAAGTDAADDRVAFVVNSGWRSRSYQEELLEAAIRTYGSRAEAARWVATPETSLHVSGEAVDVGDAAALWLSAHGAAYGLCQIYRNEPWHYELRADAAEEGCPPMYADPTQDPRMRG